MDDEALSLMHFVMRDEAQQWKTSKFDWNKFAAVRWGGPTVWFDNENNATQYIRARAMEAAVKHYHAEMAKGVEQ